MMASWMWIVLLALGISHFVQGQFNIRVGFHREDTVTSSYGRSGNGEGRNQRRTTTVSPTVDYWQNSGLYRPNAQIGQSRPLLKRRQSKFKQWLTNLISVNYDKYQPPKPRDKIAVTITVSMMIIRVHSLSDSSMDYGIELYYRERWNDYRLRFNSSDYGDIEELNLPTVSVNHVWKPDTYFLNAISAEVDSENSVTHKAFFHLRYNGDIYYSRKISLKADCPMDLTMYPFDVQTCRLKLGSYSNPSVDVVYKWAAQKGQDIEFGSPIDLAEFYAESYKTSSKTMNYTTGLFKNLELCLTFKRRAGFCIMQVFFPATAVVMSSWVALWLAEDTTFSDVLAVILAIIFLAYAYNSVMPRVSYVKLLDLYMCSCFLFVFLSLAKLVIIKYFCHKWAKQNNRSYDFFLDQLLGMSAASSRLDVEQQSNGGISSHSSSRSTHAPTEGKKNDGRLLKKKKPKRRKSTCRQNGSCVVQNSRQKISNLNMKSAVSEEEDYHSAVYPVDEEASENVKNEEVETTSVVQCCDETRSVQNAVSEPMHRRIFPSPLAALFASAGGSNLANGDSARRVTFFGLEAFAAWFDQRKKKSGAAKCLRYLRYFHVFTQLALPMAFAAFFVFLLLIYPNVPRTNYC